MPAMPVVVLATNLISPLHSAKLSDGGVRLPHIPDAHRAIPASCCQFWRPCTSLLRIPCLLGHLALCMPGICLTYSSMTPLQ